MNIYLMINMGLMLVYSNYLSFTTFAHAETMEKYWKGKLIAMTPWIIATILFLIA